MSSLSLRGKSAKLFSYDNLPLKVYFEVIRTENRRLLLIDGDATDKQLQRAWDSIVRRNEKTAGTLWYYRHVDDLSFMRDILGEYVIATAMLNKLLYKIDHSYIAELALMGYVLDTSNSKKFKKTLQNCLHNVTDLVTKFKMKVKEMESDNKDNKDSAPTFDTTMAKLSLSLGFVVPEDITLPRFNEYNKLLKQRQSKVKTLEDQDG